MADAKLVQALEVCGVGSPPSPTLKRVPRNSTLKQDLARKSWPGYVGQCADKSHQSPKRRTKSLTGRQGTSKPSSAESAHIANGSTASQVQERQSTADELWQSLTETPESPQSGVPLLPQEEKSRVRKLPLKKRSFLAKKENATQPASPYARSGDTAFKPRKELNGMKTGKKVGQTPQTQHEEQPAPAHEALPGPLTEGALSLSATRPQLAGVLTPCATGPQAEGNENGPQVAQHPPCGDHHGTAGNQHSPCSPKGQQALKHGLLMSQRSKSCGNLTQETEVKRRMQVARRMEAWKRIKAAAAEAHPVEAKEKEEQRQQWFKHAQMRERRRAEIYALNALLRKSEEARVALYRQQRAAQTASEDLDSPGLTLSETATGPSVDQPTVDPCTALGCPCKERRLGSTSLAAQLAQLECKWGVMNVRDTDRTPAVSAPSESQQKQQDLVTPLSKDVVRVAATDGPSGPIASCRGGAKGALVEGVEQIGGYADKYQRRLAHMAA